MDPRYTHEPIERLWSAEHTLDLWTAVERATAAAQAEQGLVPAAAARAIIATPPPAPERVAEAEKVTRHDVAAFVQEFARNVGEHGRWVHHGLTSSDVVDTANALRAREVAQQLETEGDLLLRALYTLAADHNATIRLGRTHGQGAEPITLARQLHVLRSQIARALRQLRVDQLPMKLSGPVGTYAYNPPAVESAVAARLGLPVDPKATQVVGRDYYARHGFALVQLASACERVALFVRLSAQTELGELSEGFQPGQVGSSAMPHKRNPIAAEQICGLSRVARGLLWPLVETESALWFERDISNSSVERVVLRDLSVLAGYLLRATIQLIRGLVVHTDRIADNLRAALPLPTPAAQLWFAVRSGADRELAYRAVQAGKGAWSVLVEQRADSDEWTQLCKPTWYLRNA